MGKWSNLTFSHGLKPPTSIYIYVLLIQCIYAYSHIEIHVKIHFMIIVTTIFYGCWSVALFLRYRSGPFDPRICLYAYLCYILYGCFPKLVVPPKPLKMIILVGKPMFLGYHHFRKPPYTANHKISWMGSTRPTSPLWLMWSQWPAQNFLWGWCLSGESVETLQPLPLSLPSRELKIHRPPCWEGRKIIDSKVPGTGMGYVIYSFHEGVYIFVNR